MYFECEFLECLVICNHQSYLIVKFVYDNINILHQSQVVLKHGTATSIFKLQFSCFEKESCIIIPLGVPRGLGGGPVSFIFMHLFWKKYCKIIRFCPKLRGWRSHLEILEPPLNILMV